MPMSTPDLFTITEAAVVLRIGRTTAYELARRDLATGGGEGLGVVRIGGQLRVPRVVLERIIGGPVTAPAGGAGQDGHRSAAAIVQLAVVPGPPTDAHTIGQRLRTARGHRSQVDLAATIGVSPRTLRGWENDEHSATVAGVKEVARVTGWPVAWIIDADAHEAGPIESGPVECAPWDLNPEPAD